MSTPDASDMVHVHAASGARLAETLFLELAGLDPDLHAEVTAEALDVAIAGMLDAVGTVNRKHGITDRHLGEVMAQAALHGFSRRWSLLCGGQGSRA